MGQAAFAEMDATSSSHQDCACPFSGGLYSSQAASRVRPVELIVAIRVPGGSEPVSLMANLIAVAVSSG
jgi:hypothetical protein